MSEPAPVAASEDEWQLPEPVPPMRRQMLAQGAATELTALLDLLGVRDDEGDPAGLSIDADHCLVLDPGVASELYERVIDLLPHCWRAETYYGSPAPEGCTMHQRQLCGTCLAEARRPPGWRPAVVPPPD